VPEVICNVSPVPVQHLHQAGLLDRHHVEALVSGEAEQKPEEVVA
jgi:hypothetical protein